MDLTQNNEMGEANNEQKKIQEKEAKKQLKIFSCVAKSDDVSTNKYTIVEDTLYVSIEILKKPYIEINIENSKRVFDGDRMEKYIELNNNPNVYVSDAQISENYNCEIQKD
jgi:CRISPR/Cas system CMR subunit Cmr4 (Cas7 group RAMP superfamily)